MGVKVSGSIWSQFAVSIGMDGFPCLNLSGMEDGHIYGYDMEIEDNFTIHSASKSSHFTNALSY